MKQLIETIKLLTFHKTYVYYSLAYGLSTLIVPLGVQFLVNSLALSRIWLNTTVFIALIIVGLILAQTIKHSQLVIVESLQREIFCIEVNKWKNFKSKGYSHYYFEILDLLKSFSKSYSNIIELALVIVFGLTTIILFHPTFLILAAVIILTIYHIYSTSYSALDSSIKESDEKYKIFDKIHAGERVEDQNIIDFMTARDKHFKFIRKNSFKIGALAVVSQAILLAFGSYLIKNNELSVGQLVSAEIIISGIFMPLSRLPFTLEAVYDYETSKYKIAQAFVGKSYE